MCFRGMSESEVGWWKSGEDSNCDEEMGVIVIGAQMRFSMDWRLARMVFAGCHGRSSSGSCYS
jgi:hypothetical protein